MQIIVSFTSRKKSQKNAFMPYVNSWPPTLTLVPHYPRVIYQPHKRDIINMRRRGPQVLIFNYQDPT